MFSGVTVIDSPVVSSILPFGIPLSHFTQFKYRFTLRDVARLSRDTSCGTLFPTVALGDGTDFGADFVAFSGFTDEDEGVLFIGS